MGVVAPFGNNKSLLRVMDGVIAALAFTCAFLLRNYLAPWISEEIKEIQPFSLYVVFVILALFLAPIILDRREFYKASTKRYKFQFFAVCFESVIILFLIMVLLDFFAKINSSRTVFMFFVPICTAALLMREYAYKYLQKRVISDRSGLVNMLVVADQLKASKLGQKIMTRPDLGYKLEGEVLLDSISVESFVKILHEKSIGTVGFEVSPIAVQGTLEYVKACEDEGIEVWFAANFIETKLAKAEVGYFDDQPIMIFKTTTHLVWQLFAKEIFDRICAFMLLLVCSPLLLIVAIGVKVTSPGPILFSQKRSGRYGRQFTMYKFRTMYADAEEKRGELLGKNEMSGPVFKLTDDPRIVPFGAFIRRHALDEIPQLWNVFTGDMSLVGPRPLPVYETQAIQTNQQRRRLSVKPGMTCLWQISGRNNVKGFDDWVNLDLRYIDEWSLLLDLKILLLTVPAVLTGRGGR